MLKRFISSLALAGLVLSSSAAFAQSAQPAQWKYRIIDGVSTATYPGDVVINPPASGGALELQSPGPWPTFSTCTELLDVNVGSFPDSHLFGNCATKNPNAIIGRIAIPSTDTGNQLGTGVSGYASTSSTTQAAVGVLGVGSITANGGNAWGLNSVTSNSPGINTGTGTGLNANVLAGVEINFNIVKKSGAVVPTISEISGLKIIGDSDTLGTPGTEAFGVNIESPGFQQAPELKWYRAIRVRDGSSNVALSVGAVDSSRLAQPTSSASQDIEFVTFNSGASRQLSRLYADSTATMFAAPTGGFNVRTTVGTVNALSIAADGKTALGLATPLAPFQVNANGAPASTGQMNTGSVFQSGAGGQALNIGANTGTGETYINSAFSNNAGTAAPLTIYTGATQRAKIDSTAHTLLTVSGGIGASFVRTTPVTLANLIAAVGTPTAGDRGIVTDANACTFAANVTGGGATFCPVYYDGSNWKAG